MILDSEAAAMLDAMTGTVKSAGEYRHGPIDATGYGGWHTDGGATYADSGGASRFFFRADYDESEVSE